MTTEPLKQSSSLKALAQSNLIESSRSTTKTGKEFSNHLDANSSSINDNNRGKPQEIDRQSRRDKTTSTRDETSTEQRTQSKRDHTENRVDDRDKTSKQDNVEAHEASQKTDQQTDRSENNNKAENDASNNQNGDKSDQEQSAQDDGQSENDQQQLTSEDKETTVDTTALLDGELTPEELTEDLSDTATALGTPALSADQTSKQNETAKGAANLNDAKNTIDKDLNATQNNLKSDKSGLQAGGASLESTLGEDAGDETKTDKSTIKDFSDLAKSLKEAGGQKETSQTTGTQNAQGNAPILTNAQSAANNPLKTGTIQTQADVSQVQTLDGGDTAVATNNSPDTKATTSATQLRAAGYTNPTQSIAFTIAQKAQNGMQKFEIRLNPPELGRVDVKLEFGKDGQISAHLIVERPETLEMLNKDSRQLERTLMEAGLNIESDDLTFSLKDQESGADTQNDNETGPDGQLQSASMDDEAEELAPIYRRMTTPSGLDISI